VDQYGLAQHVFVCSNDNYVVMLDVRRDRYFALEESKAALLGNLVRGWPAQSARFKVAGTDPPAPLVNALLRQGMLTETPGQGKDAGPVQFPTPTAELICEYERTDSSIGLRNIFTFFSSVLSVNLISLCASIHSSK
jgi:hypothetical protein